MVFLIIYFCFVVFSNISLDKTQDSIRDTSILSGFRPKIYYARSAGGKKKTELTINANRIYEDGLPSSWIQYNLTVRYRYILFVFMVS